MMLAYAGYRVTPIAKATDQRGTASDDGGPFAARTLVAGMVLPQATELAARIAGAAVAQHPDRAGCVAMKRLLRKATRRAGGG